MSGPYRFQQDTIRSPLDKQPQNVFPPGQAPNFKTNVNRMKTKKWVEAKKNAYDGDDWGEYDEYDEYGVETPPPEPSAPTGYAMPGQRLEQPSRSFTDPTRQGPPQPLRRNSFEAGDEHRAFSAGMQQPGQDGAYGDGHSQQPYAQPTHAPPRQPGYRQASAAESESSDTPQHRRDFSPSAMPPPLHTRMSPAPGSATGSPAHSQFPPRKSSIGQSDSPVAMSPRDRAPSNPTKPLPFIRPADIYKRVEEERQRERSSMDSSRPSLDSLSGRPREEITSPQGHPMETVPERKSEYLPEPQQPALPQIPGVSTFDNDLWASNSHAQAHSAQTPVVSPPSDPGFRSVVDQAFTRSDDQHSVPPTPVSKESDSGVSRSDTGSTSGISPIMSRVPSSATSALKNRNNGGADSSTPVIVEEASESSTPVSRPTSTAALGAPYQVARKPSPSHSRNVSSSSIPRAGLATPSSGESPARSPAFEPQRHLTEPESAVLSSLSPVSPEAMEGGSNDQSGGYATREADIASAVMTSPDRSVPELGAAEKQSQTAFLDSHQNAESPLPPSRSESPNKSRVQELAGKFGDVSQSRRGSTQSNASRNSIQSWERSPMNSQPPSPTKSGYPSDRPAAAREASFRPKLPGQWESYATSVQTPSERGEHGVHEAGPAGYGASAPLDEVDLTPTTSKHPVLASEPSESPSDALAALKAAGAAIGDALQASVGSVASAVANPQGGEGKDRGFGDVYLARPVALDRTASSVSSSVPPTPPAKDTPESEDLPPAPLLKEQSSEATPFPNQQQRPPMLPHLSTDPSEHDQESDRLRKEIVASLSPLRTSETPEMEATRSSLLPNVPSSTDRESSILPSEYDSYWADEQTSPRPSHDLGRSIEEDSRPSEEKSPVAAKLEPAKPSILTRFSWEDQPSHLVTPSNETQAGVIAKPSHATQAEHVATSPVSHGDKVESPNQSFGGYPDPYFGPGHVVAASKPESVETSEVTVRSPTPPPGSSKPVTTPVKAEPIREASPASGLHVVNSDINPEAVDMPPRLSFSRDASPTTDPSQVHSPISQKIQEDKTVTSDIPVSGTAPGPSALPEHESQSPTTDKPLGFRDIVNIKSSSERIATYNKTRDYWAKADHGLNDWIASTMAAKPELATQSPVQQRPHVGLTGTSRHKPTGSLSLFGKHHGSSSNQAPNAPYYEQYNSAAAQVPTTPTSASATPESRPHASFSGPGGRSASHQMQAKGKDLLHTAGVLGGKGMTSAKGLFAKGKSRFRASGSGDKDLRSDSMPSSREASEEPELVSTPQRRATMPVDFDSPREGKKKRRLSSPFHRSSRSRSRPSSIVLPKNAHLDFSHGSITTSTPPQETPPSDRRPYSYHAPDSWNVSHEPQEQANHSTPIRGGLLPPGRLGVLPSPAKSAFSLFPQDKDEVPPVPRIPEGVEERERGRSSHESASHRVLQSVMRYSTPPAMESAKSRESASFTDVPASNVHSQQDAILPQNKSAASRREHLDDSDDQPPQLNHEAPTPVAITGASLGSYSVPTATEGDISPVGSSMGAPDQEEEVVNRPNGAAGLEVKSQRLGGGDVSPMIPAATLALAASGDGTQTPTASRDNAPRSRGPAYETLQIGAGDVSPISMYAHDGEKSSPTKAMKDELSSTPTIARPTSEFALEIEKAFEGASLSNGAAPSNWEIATPLPRERLAAPRLSASPSPYQVVHAVQAAPYVPSHSSFESWDQDSVVAPSQSDGSQLGDRHEGSDIPPVPQIPSIVTQRDSSEHLEPGQKPPNSAASNIFIAEHPLNVMSPQQDQQQPLARTAEIPGNHKRSQSLLSAISSAVSADGTPVSAASSHAGKSRPSSRGRQPQGPAKASPLPEQIVEEASPASQTTIKAITTDEYDLYADHNGIVKDIQDDQGQPLRVVDTLASSASGPALHPVPATTRSQEPSRLQDEEDTTRYSDERPMSFISGPRDANGRPQDEINRATPVPMDIPPVPQIPDQLRRHPLQNGFVLVPPTTSPEAQSEPDSTQDVLMQKSLPIQAEKQDVSPPQNSFSSQYARSPSYTNVSPPPPSNASPPPQPTPPQVLAARPFLQDPRAQNGNLPDPRMQGHVPSTQRTQDPRLIPGPQIYGTALEQSYVQGPHTRVHKPAQSYAQDPYMQGQPVPPPSAARNQYELQQRMMREQTMDPRLQNGTASAGSLQPSPPPGKQEGKSSSRPKISSVFKGFGGKSSSSNAQSAHQLNNGVKPNISAPGEANRTPSYQSNLGDLPEQVAVKKDRRLNAPGSLGNRPVSVGTESHISHFSQDSTKVQAADSRLDLRYPSSPVPFQGIPPQHPPPGAHTLLRPPQPQSVSSSDVPETGKKKRFSTLGALFSRNSNSGHLNPTKVKLSKDEKKAQKAQKHTTAAPVQSPPAQQWPSQQQTGNQQYSMPYGPAPTARPFPGMQGVPPQMMPPQGVSPQWHPPKGSFVPPQGYQPPQTQLQRPDPNQSAYIATRQIAQGYTSQHPDGQGSQQPSQASRTSMSARNPSFEQRPAAPGYGPPLTGYYKPDTKPQTVEEASPNRISAHQQHLLPQQVVQARHVSSPVSSHNPNAVTPVSQRRVSSPSTEPRYETPQIPAAYNQVSGAYVTPGAQAPIHNAPPSGPLPAQHDSMFGRQYSEPQMQPISPQVSVQSQMGPDQRTYSESSAVSVISPVSVPNPSPAITSVQAAPNQRPSKPRMSSISETTQHERPWHSNLPAGATEQEIVRARHQQFMQQQLAAQQQLKAERAAQSPSPHQSRHTQSPSPQPPASTPQQPHRPVSGTSQGGFREVLPRSSPQPYQVDSNHDQDEQQPPSVQSRDSQPLQPVPIHPEDVPQPASYPLPISPDPTNIKSPVNPLADAFPPPPPPKIPHSPMRPGFPENRSPPPEIQEQKEAPAQQYAPPTLMQQPIYEENHPEEPPPSYSGPGMPNEGTEKERPRPPNILTNADVRGRERDIRQRQASIGLMQHPQPASMAASPQRSSADMGADILRRQLLQAEERERVERLQRAEIQRAETERERQERDRARARARELERSVSGGGRVGSLRSAAGSTRGRGPTFERRGSTTRPVFELSAEEDDEPVMMAASFPGQEWIPTFTED